MKVLLLILILLTGCATKVNKPIPSFKLNGEVVKYVPIIKNNRPLGFRFYIVSGKDIVIVEKYLDGEKEVLATVRR